MDYYIKTEEWEHIFKILHTISNIRTGNENKLRIFIESIWYIARSGCQWRLLPKHYGSWRAIHRRFKHWSDKGIWDKLFASFANVADMESVIMDAGIARAQRLQAPVTKKIVRSLRL